MKSEIKKALERDNFMTPNEAKDFGLIDEVVEKDLKPLDLVSMYNLNLITLNISLF